MGASAASIYRMPCRNGAGGPDCSAVCRLLHGDP